MFDWIESAGAAACKLREGVLAETTLKHRGPVGEDPSEVPLHEPFVYPVADPAQRQLVTNDVLDRRPPAGFLESVKVVPSAVGSPYHDVAEQVGRIPLFDAGNPGQGESVEPEPVSDPCSFLEGKRVAFTDGKREPVGSYLFEVTGFTEILETLPAGSGKGQVLGQTVPFALAEEPGRGRVVLLVTGIRYPSKSSSAPRISGNWNSYPASSIRSGMTR